MVGVLEQAANGLMTGALYALFAVGMVLIFGVMRVLNFAHGVMFTAGAYACQLCFTAVVGSYVISIVVSMAAMALAAMALELLVFRRLRFHLSMQIVASLGIILIVQNAIVAAFGPTALRLDIPTANTLIRIGPLTFTAQHFVIVGTAFVAVGALHLFLTRTKLGTAIRATSQNAEAARVVGINPDRIFLLVFALGGALAALGGALIGPLFLIFPQMGDLPLLKALTAIVLGGMGSVGGAIAGGIAIGLVESESTLFIPTDYRDTIVFVLLIATLLLRPHGLFGSRVRGEA